MKPFRRALFACAVAGLVTATGCTPSLSEPSRAQPRGSEPVPCAQRPAHASPAIPEPEWDSAAQPGAGPGVPLPTPLATVEWTSTPGVLPAPPKEPTRPTQARPEWIGVPAPPVVTVERGN